MTHGRTRVRRDLLKHGKTIVCYIDEYSNGELIVRTGKPSEAFCISWNYSSRADAVATATEYYNDYTGMTSAAKWVSETRSGVIL